MTKQPQIKQRFLRYDTHEKKKKKRDELDSIKLRNFYASKDTLKNVKRSSFVAQWIKDLVLSLQPPGSLLWCGFDSWPGNFHMLRAQPKRKKKKKKVKKQPTDWEKILANHISDRA